MNHHTRHDTQLLAPKNRIILLGASNLTLSLRWVIHLSAAARVAGNCR